MYKPNRSNAAKKAMHPAYPSCETKRNEFASRVPAAPNRRKTPIDEPPMDDLSFRFGTFPDVHGASRPRDSNPKPSPPRAIRSAVWSGVTRHGSCIGIRLPAGPWVVRQSPRKRAPSFLRLFLPRLVSSRGARPPAVVPPAMARLTPTSKPSSRAWACSRPASPARCGPCPR